MKNKISEEVLNIFPILLVIYEVANFLANDAYLPALPLIATQLHTTEHLVQLTLTVFFLGNATMQLILGPLSDRYGRRIILLGGGIVFIVTTMVCALTSNIHLLLTARFFQGSAVTSMIVAGYSTIHAMYDQTRAIKTLAWMNSISVLAPAIGPLFGAIILLMGSWRWIFVILALWAALALTAIYRYMPETCEPTSSLSAIKIIREYMLGLSNWRFIQPTLTLSLLFAAMNAWITAGPFLIMDLFHHSAMTFGLIQGMIFGSFILGTRLLSLLIEKIPLAAITKVSTTLAFIGGILNLVLCLVAPGYLISIMLPMMIIAIGAGIGFPVFNRLAIEGSHQTMGIKMALFSSFLGIGGFFGSMMISTFYNNTTLGFSLIVVAFTCTIMLMYLYRPDNISQK